MKYTVDLIRVAHRSVTIEVEADSPAQAEVAALEKAGDIDFPGEKEAFYKAEVRTCLAPVMTFEEFLNTGKRWTERGDPECEPGWEQADGFIDVIPVHIGAVHSFVAGAVFLLEKRQQMRDGKIDTVFWTPEYFDHSLSIVAWQLYLWLISEGTIRHPLSYVDPTNNYLITGYDECGCVEYTHVVTKQESDRYDFVERLIKAVPGDVIDVIKQDDNPPYSVRIKDAEIQEVQIEIIDIN